MTRDQSRSMYFHAHASRALIDCLLGELQRALEGSPLQVLALEPPLDGGEGRHLLLGEAQLRLQPEAEGGGPLPVGRLGGVFQELGPHLLRHHTRPAGRRPDPDGLGQLWRPPRPAGVAHVSAGLERRQRRRAGASVL